MFQTLTIAVSVILFIVQLLLCLCGRKKWLKWLPGALIGILELVCWGMYGLAVTEVLGEIHSIEMAFTGIVFGMTGLYFAGGVVLAWVVYGIIRLAQKRKRG